MLPTLESLGPPAAAAGGTSSDAIESLVSGPDELGGVEFAQEDTAKHVIPVKTKAEPDIQRELEKLRALTMGAATKPAPAAKAPAGGREIERRLKDMFSSEQTSRQQVKRKAAVEVPAALLKGNHALKIQLSFTNDAGEEVVHEATAIGLRGNKRLEWLALELEIDVKGKG